MTGWLQVLVLLYVKTYLMIARSGIRKPNMKELKQGSPLAQADASAACVDGECVVESAGSTARDVNLYAYAP